MTAGQPVRDAERLTLIVELLGELRRHGIRYCHWKSTAGLDRALAGRTDLDLLVDRRQTTDFDIVIRELGFKPFVSHPSRRFPGVEDHVGHDPASGRLVHLHVYYQLILGEQYLKNHRIPLEQAFLDGARDLDGILIPPPELELLVLGIRTLLKYRQTDAAKDLARVGRRGGIPPDTRAELASLRSQVSNRTLEEASVRHLPSLTPTLVSDLLGILDRDRRDAIAISRLRRRAVHELRSYERFPRAEAMWRSGWARLAHLGPVRGVIRGVSRGELKRKVPQGGGLTIALVGPDGAGKSTVIGELSAWLAWRLNLRVVYMGSAQPSGRTRTLKGLARGGRMVARVLRSRAVRRSVDVLVAIRYLSDARDRVSRAREGRSLASRGAVVLFDRFPLDGVMVGARLMDGPRIQTLPSAADSQLLRRLMRREDGMYAAIVPPDHIIQLVVSPNVAVERKGHRSPDAVREKSRVLLEADLSRIAPVTRVNAEQPLDAVVEAVRAAIWDLL